MQIVLAYFGLPVFIVLLRQFTRGIPYDLDEAAKVDGAAPRGALDQTTSQERDVDG